MVQVFAPWSLVYPCLPHIPTVFYMITGTFGHSLDKVIAELESFLIVFQVVEYETEKKIKIITFWAVETQYVQVTVISISWCLMGLWDFLLYPRSFYISSGYVQGQLILDSQFSPAMLEGEGRRLE